MRPYFSEGDWVFYNSPGHQFHMSFFQIVRIVPMTANHPGGYDLRYGARQVFAKENEVIHRQDPQVQHHILNPRVPATGWLLTLPKGVEVDSRYVPSSNKVLNKHEGHEIITNYAGGKEFKYCRKCKVEVF